MALDARSKRAKSVLREGAEKAAKARAQESRGASRSTATRAAYKAQAEAGQQALDILSERP